MLAVVAGLDAIDAASRHAGASADLDLPPLTAPVHPGACAAGYGPAGPLGA